MYKRYVVDEGNMVLDATKIGARIVGGKLSIKPESIEEAEGIPADRRTAKLVRSVTYTIMPMIQGEIFHQFFNKRSQHSSDLPKQYQLQKAHKKRTSSTYLELEYGHGQESFKAQKFHFYKA